MTLRRPIVVVSGKPRQLPTGDAVYGVPVKLMLLLNGGTTAYLNLDSGYGLPLLLTGGVTSSLPAVFNG